MTREEAINELLKFADRVKYQSDGDGYLGGLIRTALQSPWRSVKEELPECVYHTDGGHYSDLCLCINESEEHKILVLCEDDGEEPPYWAYGYDGEGIYDPEYDGGDITHFMSIPDLPKEKEDAE